MEAVAVAVAVALATSHSLAGYLFAHEFSAVAPMFVGMEVGYLDRHREAAVIQAFLDVVRDLPKK